MEPRLVDNPELHRYELYVGEDLAGQIAYSQRNGAVTLIHTEVDPAFKGRGLGDAIVAAALADLEERGLRMIPVCPFVRSYLERHPE
ncbi:MAG TPA: GNAT family N-acetyltransferase [Gaiellaceae bacterium]